MSQQCIQVSRVSYQYPDGTQALSDVNFSLEKGEKVALLGANGAGKSTLIELLSGFLQSDTGNIHISGKEVVTKYLSEIRKILGVVFQNPDEQLFMPTVFDDVAFGLYNLGYDDTVVADKVEQTLSDLNILALQHKAPYHLSLGQKKMVAIAGVLAMSPQILIWDEPTSSLDPLAREQTIEIIQHLTQTQLIATHDLDLVQDTCDRAIVLHRGKIVENMSPRELFVDKERLAKYHLTQPLSMQKNI